MKTLIFNFKMFLALIMNMIVHPINMYQCFKAFIQIDYRKLSKQSQKEFMHWLRLMERGNVPRFKTISFNKYWDMRADFETLISMDAHDPEYANGISEHVSDYIQRELSTKHWQIIDDQPNDVITYHIPHFGRV